MEKVKKKRMLIPVASEDIFSLERYFEEMSRQGLHFSDFHGYGVFIQGEYKNYRYYLEPYDRKKSWPDYEKVNYYEENGWELVNKFGNMYEVYRTDDPSAPELHSEVASESYVYDDLLKRMRNDMIGNIIGLFLFPIMLATIYFSAPNPVMILIKTSSVLVPLVIICSFYTVKRNISGYKRIKSIRETFLQGIDARENAEIKRIPLWKKRIGFSLDILLIVVLLILSTANFFPGRQFTLHSEDTDIYPFVALHELVEGGVEISYSPYRGVNMFSHGKEESSFFAKNIYTFYQAGDDINDEFSTAQTYFYDLNIKALAEPLAEDIMAEYDGFTFVNINDERFDMLYKGYYEDNVQSASQFLVAVYENKVMAINFRHTTPLENSLDRVYEVISSSY
ncbi:MAG: DUF2812 domain-containing protein [Anaerofustis stercorihominis]|nr:DUF2812 domain-containing protein [Anaerofustis stercorihominis]